MAIASKAPRFREEGRERAQPCLRAPLVCGICCPRPSTWSFRDYVLFPAAPGAISKRGPLATWPAPGVYRSMARPPPSRTPSRAPGPPAMLTPWAKGCPRTPVGRGPRALPNGRHLGPKALAERGGRGAPRHMRVSSAQGGRRLRSELQADSRLRLGGGQGSGQCGREATATSPKSMTTGAMSTQGARPGAGTIRLPLLGPGGACPALCGKAGGCGPQPRPPQRAHAPAPGGCSRVALA